MEIDPQKGGYVCLHLAESDDFDIYRQFTSVGIAYNLLCNICVKDLAHLAENLREVGEEQFTDLDLYCEGHIGQPEIFERPTDLSFIHEIIDLPNFAANDILDIKPIAAATNSEWMALLNSGDLVRLDLTTGTVEKLAVVPAEFMESKPPFALHISADGVVAAVVQDKDSEGMVIETATGRVTMPLNRGKYRPEHTRFPVAFFEAFDRTLMVHGTDWNRLDISNPKTGALLTERSTDWLKGEPRPPHYLDYFHDLPIISPNGEWIAEDGWVWTPVGVTRVWDLQRWLGENVWESEDGPSCQRLTQRRYFWGGPICWISNHELAIWGIGDDEEWIQPAIQPFEAETGRRLRWFAGVPRGALYFDKYLFSVTKTTTEIWDIEAGARLATIPDFTPLTFHPRTHQFLSVLPDGKLQLSRLNDLGKI